MHKPMRARLRLLLTATLVLGLPACSGDGQLCLLGYSTRPLYDGNIRTVRVPIFKNLTYYRGLEFDLTEAVIREIEAKTPFKVVAADAEADTELTGTILSVRKRVITFNQLNEVREAETFLDVEVCWRDLRSGEILSRPRPRLEEPPVPAPDLPPPSLPPEPPPLILSSVSTFIPELGESTATAYQRMSNRMATQIVSLMEAPW